MNSQSHSRSSEGAIPFSDLISALLDNSTPLSPRYLYRLSGLEGNELEQLSQTWSEISLARRRALIEDLEDLSDSNTLVVFTSVFTIALDDIDPQIRITALRALWDSEETSLIPNYLKILANDADIEVRAQAASGLGIYIYLGEIEEIPAESLERIVHILLQLVDDPQIDKRIRQKALASLGFSSAPRVPALIEESYELGDEEWLQYTLLAMERSLDKQWFPHVISCLNHDNDLIRLAAISAAGELEISDSIPHLIDMLQDQNDEIRIAAAWALSQIGAEEAQESLELLIDQTDDPDELNHLENAMENLLFNQDMIDFNLFDFDENDLDDRFSDLTDNKE